MFFVKLGTSDDVTNVIGTGCDRVGGSMKQYWMKTTGIEWPSDCRIKKCENRATVGAHVHIKGLRKKYSCYILPTCQSCNKSSDMTDPKCASVKASNPTTYAALREFEMTPCYYGAR
jgi:hypothetical protein